jgi:hypothetical protein
LIWKVRFHGITSRLVAGAAVLNSFAQVGVVQLENIAVRQTNVALVFMHLCRPPDILICGQLNDAILRPGIVGQISVAVEKQGHPGFRNIRIDLHGASSSNADCWQLVPRPICRSDQKNKHTSATFPSINSWWTTPSDIDCCLSPAQSQKAHCLQILKQLILCAFAFGVARPSNSNPIKTNYNGNDVVSASAVS